MDEYTSISLRFCRVVTNHYSTSFSLGIRLLPELEREAIYAIYAMVRMADEIVDTYYHIDQAAALAQFKTETLYALSRSYSVNPVLHAFQWAAHTFKIKEEWIHSFFRSMEMDLHKQTYSEEEYSHYIHGSAEVVGLMCMAVFCEDQKLCAKLEEPAKRLGAAFQKVNFLRDLQSDYALRGRSYFHQQKGSVMTEKEKEEIENEIEDDFQSAMLGIKQIPVKSRRGVMLAYRYYYGLFRKIRKVSPHRLMEKRMRLGGLSKTLILARTLFSY